jgi:hypothetical protein
MSGRELTKLCATVVLVGLLAMAAGFVLATLLLSP